MSKYSTLLLTTEDAKLLLWDGENVQVCFHKPKVRTTMGLIIDENIYINSPNFLFSLNNKTYEIINESKPSSGEYHHMNIYDNKIYIAATRTNQIHIHNIKLELIGTINIKPPNPKKPVQYKINYNHLNTVIKKDNKFYVNLNWFTSTQYGMSGVVVFDEDWKEIERFEMGWETHDLQFYNDDIIVICATSQPDKEINHPKRSGIMINKELVFEHDHRESFCKGLTWDDNYFYLCGGAKGVRAARMDLKGIMYIIDKKSLTLVEKITHPEMGNLKGCRILN